MSEDAPTCSACGRREEKCVCDNPMRPKPMRPKPLTPEAWDARYYPPTPWEKP